MKKWAGLVAKALSGVAGKIVGPDTDRGFARLNSRQKAPIHNNGISLRSTVGRKSITLSVVVTIGLGFSFFITKSAASADVYLVKPTTADSGGWASSMKQAFVATCDTIDSITFFVGAQPTDTTTAYTAQIYDSTPPNPIVWMVIRRTKGWKYQDMGFGVHAGVTRGKKYYLQLSISSGNWNYFYDGGNPYSWGRMWTGGFSPTGGNRDLAARVIGRTRIPQTFFGVNVYIENYQPAYRDSIIDTLVRAGMTIDREQVAWKYLQPESGIQCSTSYNWAHLDTAVYTIGLTGKPILYNHFGFTPEWASSWDSTDYPTSTYKRWGAPPKNLDATYLSGKNWFYNLIDSLVKRYGTGGSFWQLGHMGYPIEVAFPNYAIRDWEIGNEVNLGNLDSCEYWGWWDTTRYYKTPPYQYAHTHKDRARLYWLACKVAWDAIKTIDNTARIYTNAVDFINDPSQSGYTESGKQWLRDFYDEANAKGSNFTDVITYHFYHPSGQGYDKKFYPLKFQMDYDTLRAILSQKGDGQRSVWTDEGGWGTGTSHYNDVSPSKQADAVVQVYGMGISQLSNPRGPLNEVAWFSAFDWVSDSTSQWPMFGLLTQPDPVTRLSSKYSYWAYNQMTGKLNSLYFNRKVPLGNPNDSVYCYEFQTTDTGLASRKTWMVWKASDPPVPESLPVRSIKYDSIKIAYSATPPPGDSGGNVPHQAGYFKFYADTFPKYFRERDTISRPDVIVDDLYTYPPNPKAGDPVWFYARLKNIGNAAVSSSLWTSVTFQVDGVSKITYQIQRTLNIGDTVTLGANPRSGSPDWTANYGDRLIRAWADSADRYVELREDNNIGYLWKHMSH